MSIQTNLSVSPYFDDYNDVSDYYRILFKPSTAVQVRELNQLQTILQRQIEHFGDHIFKRGTLLDGCQPTFNTAIPFVKIQDTTADGRLPVLENYLGLFVKDNANLVARVIDVVDGFEAQNPDLKTLYLEYINSGDDGTRDQFGRLQPLTIYNSDLRLYNVEVSKPSVGISNSDTVVFLSALEVQNSSGGVENISLSDGDIITQPDVSSPPPRLEIISEANTTANSEAVVFSVKPFVADLAIANTAAWNFRIGEQINKVANGVSTPIGLLSGMVGRGATGRVKTLTGGAIDEIQVVRGGRDYYVPPHVTISSSVTDTPNISNVELIAENFIANVISSGVTNHANVAYGLSVSDGVIYQKGQFLRVESQSVIVEKYANTPNEVAVGFETLESVVNSSVDSTLLDNAGSFLNVNAPGADRLKLTPRLKVLSIDQLESDPEFFPIIRFSEGRPFVTSTSAVYNKLGEELAKRTFEESGNFVLDRFDITTRSPIDFEDSADTFSYIIDPGHAYVNGFRVKTDTNFAKNVSKGIQTETAVNAAADVLYGNYVRVNDMVGTLPFTTAATVSLYSDESTYFDSADFGTISAPSNKIGEARVRSVLYEQGTVGTSTAVYRIYLFDIRMNAGREFAQTKSIFGSAGGANLILEPNPRNTSQSIAVLKGTQQNSILLNTRYPAKTMNNLRYTYRSSNTATIATSSSATQMTLACDDTTTWPYSGVLSFAEKQEIIVIPDDTLVFTANVGVTSGSANTTHVTGSGTSFLTSLKEGDHITIGAGGNYGRVLKILSDTSLTYQGGNLNTDTGTIYKVYPKGIPIPLTDATAQISSNTLQINFNEDFVSSQTATVVYNMRTLQNTAAATKDVSRNRFVKIDMTAGANTSGPWCIGFSDVFRLRKVYEGSNTSGLDVTSEFYIDHNQNENFYDLSYLYKKPNSRYEITANSVFLVEFDHFISSERGLKTISSYTIDDTKPLESIGANVHTMEIPEVLNKNNELIDLRECLDFRPISANTVASVTDPASAPINPSETLSFGTSNLKLPTPESDVFYDVEFYKGRTDTIVLNPDGIFDFKIGRVPRSKDPNEFSLYQVNVPPYPSLPKNLSLQMEEIIDTGIANEIFTNGRRNKFSIKTEQIEKQTPAYTMENISQLERRIEILEYYNNITLLENQIKDRVIPSSVDATLERFKFGFFVDNFSSEQFTDKENPEYTASIFGHLLQPAKMSYNLSLGVAASSRKYVDRNSLHFPYERRKIVTQTFATIGPPPPVIPEDPPEPEIETVCQFISNQNTKNDKSGLTVFEESIFTLSSNPQADGLPITINFDVYGGVDRLEFYQSQNPNGPWGQPIATHEGPFAPGTLTTAERITLRNLKLKRSNGQIATWNNPDFSYRSETVDGVLNSKFWIINTGKIVIPYNLTGGRYFKVRNIKGSPIHTYYICYPADGFVDPILRESPPITLPPPETIPTANTPPPVCIPGPETRTVLSRGKGFITYWVTDGCTGRQVTEEIIKRDPPKEPIIIDPPPPSSPPSDPGPIDCGGNGVPTDPPPPETPPVYTNPDPVEPPPPAPPPPEEPPPPPPPATVAPGATFYDGDLFPIGFDDLE